MSRHTGPKWKLCRREGMDLFSRGVHGARAESPLHRKDYPPGMHAHSRRKITEYGLRLREKQKLKRIFGVRERQFKRYYHEAERLKGNTGENLLMLLERRLDNVVVTSGFALTLAQARQLVAHGHFLVNGKRCTIPSRQIRPGDTIEPRTKGNTRTLVSQNIDLNKSGSVPNWLEVTPDSMQTKMVGMPTRADFPFPIQEQLIIEFCSK
jgi:small subunit ribosomal protein S4